MLDPAAPIDADGVILVADLVEKPARRAPCDYILIGRYVLTPDVFDEIERLTPGSGGELQLTDARCGRRPSGHRSTACSRVARYDTGNPIWPSSGRDAFALRDPNMGTPVRELLAAFTQGVTARV